jgi:hypothetical protein
MRLIIMATWNNVDDQQTTADQSPLRAFEPVFCVAGFVLMTMTIVMVGVIAIGILSLLLYLLT